MARAIDQIENTAGIPEFLLLARIKSASYGDNPLGFKITVQPAASAGATFAGTEKVADSMA